MRLFNLVHLSPLASGDANSPTQQLIAAAPWALLAAGALALLLG